MKLGHLLPIASAAFAVPFAEAFSCAANLLDYTERTSEENLKILLGGGDMPDDAPVYFDVPTQQIDNGEALALCVENLTIPQTVGGNVCNSTQRCWLAVGYHAASGEEANEYECLCSGADLGTGAANDVIADGCGLSQADKWGVSCPDVMNGRGDSKEATVQITVCSPMADGCNVCSGGDQPPYRVGLRWLSNQDECSEPFGGSGAIHINNFSIALLTSLLSFAASAVMLLF